MTRGARTTLLLAGDCVLGSLSLMLALLLRMEFRLPSAWLPDLPWLILLSLGVKIPALHFARMYSISLSFVGLRDAVRLAWTVAASSGVFLILFLAIRAMGAAFFDFPVSAPLIDAFLFILLVGGWRMSKRLAMLWVSRFEVGEPTLIVGAGGAADQVLRTMLDDSKRKYEPVAMLDDDRGKLGTRIHGVPVAGSIAEMPAILAREGASVVVIALPTAPAAVVRKAFELARQAGAREVLVLPDSRELLRPELTVRDLRRIELKDLLRRDEIKLDEAALAPHYRGQTLLVTGAAGSIGSELCRQACRLAPSKLILLDREETGLFNIHQELRARFADVTAIPSLSDIREGGRLEQVLREHRPSVLFHSAAYKHVPMLESNSDQALANNVQGTITLARAAVAAGVGKFVFISTDKAADPVSVMGKTKRAGELLARLFDRLGGPTRFVSVRFGNVLGSRGSVLEIFADQIRNGRPITITDPEMTRYFMLTSEAVLLVLHAGALGKGGETFVLDMGEPIRIRDLAEQMARLAGLEPGRDIPIVTIGGRPGERTHERLHSEREKLIPSGHPKLFVAVGSAEAGTERTADLLRRVESAAAPLNGRPASDVIDELLAELERNAG